jgi:hypothetical protein
MEVCVWLFFVETHGYNLEEIDAIFESANPVERSLEREKVVVVGVGD